MALLVMRRSSWALPAPIRSDTLDSEGGGKNDFDAPVAGSTGSDRVPTVEHVARRRGMGNMRYLYAIFICNVCVHYLCSIFICYICAIYMLFMCNIYARYTIQYVQYLCAICIYVYNIYVRYTRAMCDTVYMCDIYMCIFYVQHSFMYAMLGGGRGWRIYC